MPRYRYKARSKMGGRIMGDMQALDELDLAIQLQRIGLELRSAKEWDGTTGMGLGDMLMLPFHWLAAALEWSLSLVVGRTTPASDGKHFVRTRAHRRDIRDRIAKGDTNKMPTFMYMARTVQGNRVDGEMEAKDEQDLALRLQLIELSLVKSSRFTAEEMTRAGSIGSYRVSFRDQMILAQQLEIYFQLDMLLPEILDAVRVGSDSPRLKKLLIGIRNHVAQGDSLYTALNRYRQGTFSRFFMAVIETGELTGRFSGVLMYANRHFSWLDGFYRRVIEELRWQLTSVVIMSLLSVGIIAYKGSMHYLITPGLILAACWCFFRAPIFEPIRNELFLKLPFVGKAMRANDTLNFTFLFSLMWSAGITVAEAIDKANSVVSSRKMRAALETVATQVHRGAKPSVAMANSELFEPLVVVAFSKAETTGNFEAALDGVYYFNLRTLEDQAESALSALKLVLYAACLFLLGVINAYL